MFTSWAHHRDHKEENVSEQQHPSNHNTPDTSPRSSAFEPHGPDQSTTEDSWQSGLHYRAGRQAGGGA
ncbi:hypothetical protein BDV93DRAFT_242949 [Ceratobasidium sp. AG-I]|nr:hypothetical protein BDV93DRAFT_242949 [Ceratobasidium sp. AG-I]